MTDEISDGNLGIDVATTPELDDSELRNVLEALLLVVDTPATVDQLASVTEQPGYRIVTTLTEMAADLAARDSGIDLREAGGARAGALEHLVADVVGHDIEAVIGRLVDDL